MKVQQLAPQAIGSPLPLGATVHDAGINFALYSKHAQSVILVLKETPDSQPFQEIPLTRTGDIWHTFVEGAKPPLYYAYRVDGPKELFFRSDLLMLDPYAKEVSTGQKWGSRKHYQPMGALLPPEPFNWENIQSPRHPLEKLIIYEMHVRGFTEHPSSNVAHRGTYLGLIEKIPYLKELGVNAIELLPLQEFNENEIRHMNPVTHKRLYQYWGYSTVNFFAPMGRYASQEKIGAAVNEFKTLVKECHRHGIEVILDVVFNHTAEGGPEGPTLSFKGIDAPTYYILEAENKFANYTGCGNTFNCNHPVVRDFIIDCLRYWVLEMHVDGFRFDLASVLLRGRKGQPLEVSPLVEAISEDPILSTVKLIAEPWDAAGLYHVGFFYTQANRWSEWNGKYRDCVRKYIKGTPESKGLFITRLCGSQDLYHNRSPLASLNFVVAHDGFTLNDLVTYNEKHNLENGEENRDGMNENESWNCGEEGPANQKQTTELRQQQLRNFHLALMISLGIPMIHMGDEYGHTKKGNNNTWSQDNELNYFLWDQAKTQEGLGRFFRGLHNFRLQNPLIQRKTFLGQEDVVFHGHEPFKPDWSPQQSFVAFTLVDKQDQRPIYVAFNAKNSSQIIEFPKPPEGKQWHQIVYTGNPSPHDFTEESAAAPLQHLLFKMHPFTSLLLKAY